MSDEQTKPAEVITTGEGTTAEGGDEDGLETEAGAEVIVDDEATREPEVPKEVLELRAKLEKEQQTVRNLSKALGDPDVTALLDAKEKGHSVVLRTTGNEPEAPDPDAMPDEPTLDTMTPSQLARTLLKQIPKMVRGSVEEALEPLGQKLDGLEAETQVEKTAKLKGEVDALVKKYPDLGDYKEEIKPLCKAGLSIEEAYLVSRQRSGKGLPVQRTVVERPRAITVYRPKEHTKPAQGPRAFEKRLSEVLDNIQEP